MTVSPSTSTVIDNDSVTPCYSGIIDGMDDLLSQRIKARLAIVKRSAAAVSKDATGNEDAIRRIYRGHSPNGERLAAIARELQTNADWLLGNSDDDAPLPQSMVARPQPGSYGAPAGRDGVREAERVADESIPFPGRGAVRDVPVLGTAMGSEMRFSAEGQAAMVEMVEIDHNDIVDYVRRPPSLVGRKDVYAIYVSGISMQPRYFPGGLQFVDTRREPSIGDGVILQVAGEGEDGESRVVSVLVKTLLRRTADYIELEQYNPALTFQIPRAKVIRMHRIMDNNELYGL